MIETDREDIKQLFAPYAPGITLRIKALKEVHNVGGIHSSFNFSGFTV